MVLFFVVFVYLFFTDVFKIQATNIFLFIQYREKTISGNTCYYLTLLQVQMWDRVILKHLKYACMQHASCNIFFMFGCVKMKTLRTSLSKIFCEWKNINQDSKIF